MESDQKALVEQLQKKIAEENARCKQMDYNLDKEKENNRRLYEQYLKILKEFQNLHKYKLQIRKKIEYEKQIKEKLIAEKVFFTDACIHVNIAISVCSHM